MALVVDGGGLVNKGGALGTGAACCCNKCSGPCGCENPCPEGCVCCDGTCVSEPPFECEADPETELCCWQCDTCTQEAEQTATTLRGKCGECPGGLSDEECDAFSFYGCRYVGGDDCFVDLCGEWVFSEEQGFMVPPPCGQNPLP
jgi:hypothetical protein